jgi:hypothetical protein
MSIALGSFGTQVGSQLASPGRAPWTIQGRFEESIG